MSTRLLSLVVFGAAILLLWAMPPRRRRGRRKRTTTEQTGWAGYISPNEAEEAKAKAESQKIREDRRKVRKLLRRRPYLLRNRRRGRRRSNLWVVPFVLLSIALVAIMLGVSGVPPFSTYVERFLPVSSTPAPTVLPAILVQTATKAPVPTPATTYASTANPSAAQVSAATVTSVPIAVLSHSPSPTPSPMPSTSTPTLSVDHTSTPVLSPTIAPTAPPMPVKHLLLETEAEVKGYWSDGTADIELKMSLLNQGRLPFEDTQAIIISCSTEGNTIDSCSTDTEVSLPDGFAPVATSLIVRAPMALVMLEIDYGGYATSTIQVNVPERILGVARDTWECYSDRETSTNQERFHGCYGWYKATVEKWRSGSTVKVLATGQDDYIRAFKETLDEQLAPILNLTFEWASSEFDADLVAYLGVAKSEARDGRWSDRCLHAWGCGGVNDVRNGEVREGDLVVFHLEKHDRFLNDYSTLKKVLNGVFIHEGLHALAPTSHADQGKVGLSSMHSSGYLTYIDKAVLSLNSHPLVKPGMTMREVESLIIFEDELLGHSPNRRT